MNKAFVLSALAVFAATPAFAGGHSAKPNSVYIPPAVARPNSVYIPPARTQSVYIPPGAARPNSVYIPPAQPMAATVKPAW